MLVSDDGSQDPGLMEVCRKWNVPLIGNKDQRLGHQVGDLAVYKRGLQFQGQGLAGEAVQAFRLDAGHAGHNTAARQALLEALSEFLVDCEALA